MNKEAIERLIGQLAGLRAICGVLIETHHDPVALKAALSSTSEKGIATLLPSSGPEPLLQGFQETIDSACGEVDRRFQKPDR